MAFGYRIYFTERAKNRVVCWDPDSGDAEVVAGEPRDKDPDQYLKDPYGLAMDKSGRLLIADKLNHRVCRLENQRLSRIPLKDEDGHRLPRPDTRRGIVKKNLECPTGIAVEQDGSLIVSFADDHTIYRVKPSGRLELLAGIPPNRHYTVGRIAEEVSSEELADTPLWGPTSVVKDSKGSLYFIERGYQVLRRLNLKDGLRCVFPFAGWQTSRWMTTTPSASTFSDYHPTFPSSMAFDGNGVLYLTDVAQGSVMRLSFNSDRVEPVVSKPTNMERLGGPAGLAIGPDNVAWVVDSLRNRVQGYDVTSTGAWQERSDRLDEVGGRPLQFYSAGAGVVCG